jgi:shikimate dehydrogenase
MLWPSRSDKGGENKRAVRMLEKLKQPTFYFIGVTTSKSSIMEIFPKWIRELNLPVTKIAGYDIEINGPAGKYREIVQHIKDDNRAVGALVTTHKIDIVVAAREIFDHFDKYAEVLREVSCISKRDGKLMGAAKDPISSGYALEAFLPLDYWTINSNAQVFIIGTGGAGIALSIYLMDKARGNNVPSKIILADRERSRLEHCRYVHSKTGGCTEVEYVHSYSDSKNDDVMGKLPEGSLVVNATGAGKDRPGEPVSHGVMFPKNGCVWDFNYRGSLEFLRSAEKQKKDRGLFIEDGWTYFICGWALVIGEVFNIEMSRQNIESLCRIADPAKC